MAIHLIMLRDINPMLRNLLEHKDQIKPTY